MSILHTVVLQFEVLVYEGSYAPHINQLGAEVLDLKPLCSAQHQRTLMAPGVTRIPVRHGPIRGMLFLPPGQHQ